MSDWFKALLMGVVLTVGILLVPILIAILTPVLLFLLIVLGIWLLLQVLQPDPPEGDDDDKPP